MPGHFVHCIVSPAVLVGDRLCSGLDRPGHDYGSVGTLLFLSTPAQQLSLYDVYHSDAEFSLGPFHQRWVSLGTIVDLCGWMYTEGFCFSAGEGGCDFYARASTNRPSFRYAHYKLSIANPADFWQARDYVFVKRADMPKWAVTPISCL